MPTYQAISLMGQVEFEFDSSLNQLKYNFGINKLNWVGHIRRHWGLATFVKSGC